MKERQLIDDLDQRFARLAKNAGEMGRYLSDRRATYELCGIFTPENIDHLVENDRRIVELAKAWPTMTMAKKVSMLTPGPGTFLAEGNAADLRFEAEVAEEKERHINRERGKASAAKRAKQPQTKARHQETVLALRRAHPDKPASWILKELQLKGVKISETTIRRILRK